MANARATNKNAIVFNPAIPNYNLYDVSSEKYTAKATSYVISGEMLSVAYGAMGIVATSPFTPLTLNPFDDLIGLIAPAVFGSTPFWETETLSNPEGSIIEDHSIQSVINALEG